MRKFFWAAAFAASISTQGSAEPDAKTVRLWRSRCASCHGADGKAKTETGATLGIPDMTTAAWQQKVSEAQMKTSINEGVKRPGKPQGMLPYRGTLKPEQIDALIAYIRTLGK